MARKYHLTYHLIEGEEQKAINYCNEHNAHLQPYAKRKYPAHYTEYSIKDNYGPGKDWTGWIVWYHYATC